MPINRLGDVGPSVAWSGLEGGDGLLFLKLVRTRKVGFLLISLLTGVEETAVGMVVQTD